MNVRPVQQVIGEGSNAVFAPRPVFPAKVGERTPRTTGVNIEFDFRPVRSLDAAIARYLRDIVWH